MFIESFMLYNFTSQIIPLISGRYRNELIQERNVETGVYICKESLKNAKVVNLNQDEHACSNTLAIDLDVTTEPVGIILEKDKVYMTIPEIKYISTIQQWDTPKTAGVLKYIKNQQILRALVFQT